MMSLIRKAFPPSSILTLHVQKASFKGWTQVPQAPGDPILGLNDLFIKDKSPEKVNLGVGAYRDGNGKPWVLPSVSMAEKKRFGGGDTLSKDVIHEYLAIPGNPDFVKNALKLAYGEEIFSKVPIAGCQTISGTGALRLAAEFLSSFYKAPVYIPQPSWPNHMSVFKYLQFDAHYYKYWDPKGLKLDFEGLIYDIKAAPQGSIFILHVCAQNPTGCDPTQSQWIEIEKAMSEKNHFCFFDMAYQGFASGDTNEDVWPVRYFIQQGHKPILCQSFAKNMGLYGQRTGTMSIVCETDEEKERCMSQLKALIRLLYSSPPRFGSEVAAILLTDPEINTQWLKDMKTMSSRVSEMRQTLYSLLDTKYNIKWNHILTQKGMFAFTGLTEEQTIALREQYHIYMTKDGRISIPGLNPTNIEYVADSIAKIIKTVGNSSSKV